MTKTTPVRELARKIATSLFTTGSQETATRLELKDGQEKSLGGWCFEAAVSQIETALKESKKSKEPTPRLETTAEYRAWSQHMKSRRGQWTIDQVHNGVFGNRLLAYLPDADGQGSYITVALDGVMSSGRYRDAIPSIGDAIFSQKWTKHMGSFETALEVADATISGPSKAQTYAEKALAVWDSMTDIERKNAAREINIGATMEMKEINKPKFPRLLADDLNN